MVNDNQINKETNKKSLKTIQPPSDMTNNIFF